MREESLRMSGRCKWHSLRHVSAKMGARLLAHLPPVYRSRTRDGVVCILNSGEDGDPVPKCPLPEYDDDLLTMPVSQMRNAAMTDPDDQEVQVSGLCGDSPCALRVLFALKYA